MPTVLRLGSLRVTIYPNDHRPAHVHVIGPNGEAVFVLGCPDGPVTLREVHGFSFREASSLARAINERVPDLCAAWEAIHG